MGITTMVGLFMTLITTVFRMPLLSLYGITDGAEGSMEALAMYAANTRYAYIMVPYFLCGLMEVNSGVLRGMGKSFVSMIISLVGACLLRVIWLMTVFPAYPTLEIIFVSYPITWVVTVTTAFTVIQVLLKKMLKAKEQNMNTIA
jgi:Na+-driven multidrug efflux pump